MAVFWLRDVPYSMQVNLRDGWFVGWLLACLASQHASVSQGRSACLIA